MRLPCPEYEFVGVFADRGITGTTDNRPEFQKMLTLCREGKVDLIITKSISRFARNTLVMLKIVRELKELGVEVRFEKENINTLSGDGELMLTVLSSFAQEESKNVSDNLKWRVRKRFEKGELMINTTRFLGYDKDEYGELIINEYEAKIVRRIFKEYLSGKGSFTIAKELNVEGIPTIIGAKWHDTTILGILKNEKYKGDALLQKTYTVDFLTKKRAVK
ncbi:transposon Tn3 resolvase [Clostridium tepidiprofundi DSM 19306]|uniref:Transposon Tn3 resolvase n=1 Tax=Clostridium tepidiprofundi DSM 19306 TaxID=1121338 RepID=A0A151ATR7_9CLOT|nr:recombinase family protein [Clostridium tepidiprofundi]KYH30787.1 transposon Tn3 resolvase [Clostridium tepidiprofundi DSM 19306]